jgi:hypothetical protein
LISPEEEGVRVKMANVSLEGSITVFHEKDSGEDEATIDCPEYLQRREEAERAAAKRSATIAARRIHQELAQLMHAARMQIHRRPPSQ